ncbi:MAG TPA: tetratricopeptide repeat protein [Tenuifilaceae bacterium]|nr:tetratricopeptide repeat protein [Tenuifilaceae bacterium]
MMRLKKNCIFLFFIAFILLSLTLLGQTNNSNNDTIHNINLSKALISSIDSLYSIDEFDSTLNQIDKALPIFKNSGHLDFIAISKTIRGSIYSLRGDYAKSLIEFYSALEYYKNINDKRQQGLILNHIGAVYRLRGDYPSALDYYFKALSFYQELNYKKGISSVLNNIGIVHLYQKFYDKALEYYSHSLKIEEELNDVEGIGISYLNIGEAYRKKGDLDKAIDNYLNALVYTSKTNDLDGTGTIYNEIAGINIEKENINEVLKYLNMAKDVFTSIKSTSRLAECELNYGKYYETIENYKESIKHYKKALLLAQKSEMKELISNIHKELSEDYDKLNSPVEAYKNFKLYITSRDSLFNEDNTRKSIQAELMYKFERQQEQIKIEQAKRDATYQEKIHRESVVRNLLIALVIFAVVIVILTFYYLVQIRKKNANLNKHQYEIVEKNEELMQQQEEILAQRDEIERKNLILEQSQQIIEDKNHRMVSSIEYAQTIQKALLPKEETLKNLFTDHFVIYLPKDIVSGDFYWTSTYDNFVYTAVMDCTGHGVPGSFMSLIGNTLLNKIVNEWRISDPASILEKLNGELRKALKQDQSDSKLHAGIDLAFVKIDKLNKKGYFAGAGRPLVVVQNGNLSKLNYCIRTAGGFQPAKAQAYFNVEFDLTSDTTIYMFTDGYPDQMSSERKKIGQQRLINTLGLISENSMDKQREILLNTLETHMHGADQLDDICIMGIKITL